MSKSKTSEGVTTNYFYRLYKWPNTLISMGQGKTEYLYLETFLVIITNPLIITHYIWHFVLIVKNSIACC